MLNAEFHTLAGVQERVVGGEACQRTQGAESATQFAICVGGVPVGGVGLEPGEGVYRHIEEHWGRGIVSEALAWAVGHAFTTLGFWRLSATLLASNADSARVLEKAGFQLEGHRWKACLKARELLDDLIYGLLQEEWEEGQGAPPAGGRGPAPRGRL
eukprot:scaffold8.g1429.t1